MESNSHLPQTQFLSAEGDLDDAQNMDAFEDDDDLNPSSDDGTAMVADQEDPPTMIIEGDSTFVQLDESEMTETTTFLVVQRHGRLYRSIVTPRPSLPPAAEKTAGPSNSKRSKKGKDKKQKSEKDSDSSTPQPTGDPPSDRPKLYHSAWGPCCKETEPCKHTVRLADGTFKLEGETKRSRRKGKAKAKASPPASVKDEKVTTKSTSPEKSVRFDVKTERIDTQDLIKKLQAHSMPAPFKDFVMSIPLLKNEFRNPRDRHNSGCENAKTALTCCDLSWQGERHRLVEWLSSASKADSKPAPKDDLKKDNPLKVEGVAKKKPKPTPLPTASEEALREFFETPLVRLPDEEWKKLSAEERSEAQKASALPRWALSAVREDPKNLDRILNGELTAKTFNAEQTRPVSSGTTAGQAWQKLKKRFAGVGLFHDPITPSERSFKQAFDSLKKKFPDSKNLPRPKKNPAKKKNRKNSDSEGSSRTNSRSSSRSRSGSRTPSARGEKTEIESLVGLAKLAGVLFKAFNGK